MPSRVSILATETTRGASLGVFSSSQFFGAFVGGVVGGRFIAGGDPSLVFLICVMFALIWLAVQGLVRPKTAG